jgi:hypothetical protein
MSAAVATRIMYRCCECGQVYEFRSSAAECCQPKVATVHQCPHCNEVHDDEWEAQNCHCLDDDPPPVSIAELERQGQLRLFES